MKKGFEDNSEKMEQKKMLVYVQWRRAESEQGRKQANRRSPFAPTVSVKRWEMLVEKWVEN